MSQLQLVKLGQDYCEPNRFFKTLFDTDLQNLGLICENKKGEQFQCSRAIVRNRQV